MFTIGNKSYKLVGVRGKYMFAVGNKIYKLVVPN